jgi:hypothetical protein
MLREMASPTLGSNVLFVTTLSFVIPSEAEGSAVQRTFLGSGQVYPQTELSSRPERSVVERSAVLANPYVRLSRKKDRSNSALSSTNSPLATTI